MNSRTCGNLVWVGSFDQGRVTTEGILVVQLDGGSLNPCLVRAGFIGFDIFYRIRTKGTIQLLPCLWVGSDVSVGTLT